MGSVRKTSNRPTPTTPPSNSNSPSLPQSPHLGLPTPSSSSSSSSSSSALPSPTITPRDGNNNKGKIGTRSEAGVVDGGLCVYVKAGVDGQRMGACPFCQRVFMVLMVKANCGLLKFKVITTNPAKPPPEFKLMGLQHVPAIIHGEEGFDALDDIINYIEDRFPGGGLDYISPQAELATKDFFSRFCYFIKAVNSDPSKLDQALASLDQFLQDPQHHNNTTTKTTREEEQPPSSAPQPVYLCGDALSHLDCEVMPKLQHLRVAAKALKNYDIPTHLMGFWRYLHAAYTHPVFTQTCPSDQEIILHWHDRPETPKLSHKQHATMAKQRAKYSFDVPVRASVVTVLDDE